MTDNTNNTENPINANELADVNGGSLTNGGAFEGPSIDGDWSNPKDLTVGGVGYVHNSKDQVVGYTGFEGTICYWPCPKCGKPMHKGTLGRVYCDPCGESYVELSHDKIWEGSKIELSSKSL